MVYILHLVILRVQDEGAVLEVGTDALVVETPVSTEHVQWTASLVGEKKGVAVPLPVSDSLSSSYVHSTIMVA